MSDKKNYITLARMGEGEYEEKASVFIGCAIPIESEEEALEFIKSKKKEYHDARHNVYAYILPDKVTQRYSDDGEPQGTAGIPILSVISKRGLCGACVVVTRYFGGTLLGAGGLVRAYTQAASAALDSAGIKRFEKFTPVEIKLSYSDYQKLGKLLSPHPIINMNVDYADSVTVSFLVKSDCKQRLLSSFTEISAGRWLVCEGDEEWGEVCE